MTNIELLVLDSSTWNHLTVCKQMSSGSFENNVTYKLFTYKSYIWGSLNKFPDFFRLARLLIVHTWNSSPPSK